MFGVVGVCGGRGGRFHSDQPIKCIVGVFCLAFFDEVAVWVISVGVNLVEGIESIVGPSFR